MKDPKAYDHRTYLEKLTRLHKKCRRSMKIGNAVEASTKAKEPKNGFVYKEWPYYECKRCHYSETL